MTAPMQCQAAAARFASGDDVVDVIRYTTVHAAIRRLVSGDRAGALQEMYDGLALQAPLSFKAPVVSP